MKRHFGILILGSALLLLSYKSEKPHAQPLDKRHKAIIATEFMRPKIIPGIGYSKPSPILQLAVKNKTVVKSISCGKVVSCEYLKGYGNSVLIRSTDSTFFRYFHLSSFLVDSGEIVKAGKRIARTGSTGLTTEPKLGIKVFNDSTRLNPCLFFDCEAYRKKE